jgi:cell division protein FtsB
MGSSQKSFFKRLLVVMASSILLLFLAYGLFGKGGYFELRRIESQNQELIERIEQLREENKKILSEIKALKTDPKTIEKIAREELGLVKPGEIKITTNQPAPASSNATPGAESSSSKPEP